MADLDYASTVFMFTPYVAESVDPDTVLGSILSIPYVAKQQLRAENPLVLRLAEPSGSDRALKGATRSHLTPQPCQAIA